MRIDWGFRICEFCSKEFERISSENSWRFKRRRFCSLKCANDSRSANLNSTPLRERLLAKCKPDDNGCWNWTGAKGFKGYGVISVPGICRSAHRAAYHEFCGPIPEGLHVLHKCDNRACINPAHLFLGTNLDNILDRMAKGRSTGSLGESHPKAKLTEAAVREIRASPSPAKVFASIHRVSVQTIYAIRNGRSWGHVA